MKTPPWAANAPKEDDIEPNNPGGDTAVIDRPAPVEVIEPKTKLPPLYHVFILNDDYTPYQVVIIVIMAVFAFSEDEATRRMRTAHLGGRALMGTFAKDIAETKAEQVSKECKKYGDFPLQCSVEEAPTAD